MSEIQIFIYTILLYGCIRQKNCIDTLEVLLLCHKKTYILFVKITSMNCLLRNNRFYTYIKIQSFPSLSCHTHFTNNFFKFIIFLEVIYILVYI